jgi:hypothetical protein
MSRRRVAGVVEAEGASRRSGATTVVRSTSAAGVPKWLRRGRSYPTTRRARSHSAGRVRPQQTTTSESGRPVTNTCRTSGNANNWLRISSTLSRPFET